LPALSGITKTQEGPQAERPQVQLGDDQILAERKVGHFGQVLAVEDVERVINMADSIMRIPFGCRFISTRKTNQQYSFGIGIDKWGMLGKYPDAASSRRQ
jgi:hypothetical protein